MLEMKKEVINWEDFKRIDFRLGTITKAEVNQKAKKPAYKLWLDLGELGEKTSSGQFTRFYKPQDMVGKKVLCVVNFLPRNIAGFLSEVLVTGFLSENGIALAVADKPISNGAVLC